MSEFQFTPPEEDLNRAGVLVDDTFDISLLRAEEGVIINHVRFEEE